MFLVLYRIGMHLIHAAGPILHPTPMVLSICSCAAWSWAIGAREATVS